MNKLSSLTALLCVPLLAACAPIQGGAEHLYWNVQKKFQKPGESLVAMPETVWKKYRCQDRALPYLVVEKSRLFPKRLQRGESFLYQVTYSMCPVTPSRVIDGTYRGTLYFRGEVLQEEELKDFEIKPGTWTLTMNVPISRSMEKGVYSYEAGFSGRDGGFSLERVSFVVE